MTQTQHSRAKRESPRLRNLVGAVDRQLDFSLPPPHLVWWAPHQRNLPPPDGRDPRWCKDGWLILFARGGTRTSSWQHTWPLRPVRPCDIVPRRELCFEPSASRYFVGTLYSAGDWTQPPGTRGHQFCHPRLGTAALGGACARCHGRGCSHRALRACRRLLGMRVEVGHGRVKFMQPLWAPRQLGLSVQTGPDLTASAGEIKNKSYTAFWWDAGATSLRRNAGGLGQISLGYDYELKGLPPSPVGRHPLSVSSSSLRAPCPDPAGPVQRHSTHHLRINEELWAPGVQSCAPRR